MSTSGGPYLTDHPHASRKEWTNLLHTPQLGLYSSQQYRIPSVVQCALIMSVAQCLDLNYYQQPAPLVVLLL